MSLARGHFIGRMDAIRAILADQISIDTAPVPTQNSAAVTVRNGCMVMLFCALEGFIRSRSLECARTIDQTTVPYTHLPIGLKEASLIATFEGLMNLSRSWPVADKLAEFERASVAAASGSLGSTYQFTDYSFGRDKSNVSANDVAKITKGFGVPNFWATARGVSQSAGIAQPGNMDEVFTQLAKERHKAAHVASHNVTHSLISAAIPEALTIALTFDTLISAATHRLSTSAIGRGVSPTPIAVTDVNFLVLKPHRTGWAAFQQNRSRAAFVDGDYNSALTKASSLARQRGLAIVCKDTSGRATGWKTIIG